MSKIIEDRINSISMKNNQLIRSIAILKTVLIFNQGICTMIRMKFTKRERDQIKDKDNKNLKTQTISRKRTSLLIEIKICSSMLTIEFIPIVLKSNCTNSEKLCVLITKQLTSTLTY